MYLWTLLGWCWVRWGQRWVRLDAQVPSFRWQRRKTVKKTKHTERHKPHFKWKKKLIILGIWTGFEGPGRYPDAAEGTWSWGRGPGRGPGLWTFHSSVKDSSWPQRGTPRSQPCASQAPCLGVTCDHCDRCGFPGSEPDPHSQRVWVWAWASAPHVIFLSCYKAPSKWETLVIKETRKTFLKGTKPPVFLSPNKRLLTFWFFFPFSLSFVFMYFWICHCFYFISFN